MAVWAYGPARQPGEVVMGVANQGYVSLRASLSHPQNVESSKQTLQQVRSWVLLTRV